MQMFSHTHPHQHNLFYHEKYSIVFKKLGWSFLLWFIGLTSIFLLTLLHSPHPFTSSPLLLSDDRQPPMEKQDQDMFVDNYDMLETCDVEDGMWVRERRASSYTQRSCPTMPESKNCEKYGKNMDFVNWIWKPNGCELPRFDPGSFLGVVRGKTMAFIGDSVARNQFDSLLCLLSQAETPNDIYKDSEDRFRTFHFPSHNFTLMILWSKFLVNANERKVNESGTGVFNIHVDSVDNTWAHHLPSLDIAIVSSAHWYFRKNYLYERKRLLGCTFCSDPNAKSLTIPFAIGKAIETALRSINNHRNCRQTLLTLVRTFSPAHFENGSWDNGGYCNRTRPTSKANTGSTDWEIRKAQVEEVGRARRLGGKKRFEVLDVTKAMLMRGDGHPGKHWNNEWMKGYNDCVHWCLPGPIDLWNQLLLAVITGKFEE